jgi:hypothetical protein
MVVGVSATPRPLYPLETDPVPIVQEAGWVSGRSGRVWNISSPQGFDPRTFQPVASRFSVRSGQKRDVGVQTRDRQNCPCARGGGVVLACTLNLTLGWAVLSYTFRPFYTLYPLYRRLGGPRAGRTVWREKYHVPVRNRTTILRSSSSYLRLYWLHM